MKTFNTLYLSLILLSSSLPAADKLYSFIGIQSGATIANKNTAPTIGLKYGTQTRKYRTSLSYSYGEQSQTNYQSIIVKVDTGILTKTFKNSSFKPYAGVAFGAMQENNKLTSVKDRGYLYGLGTGITYIYNDAFDFDLSYQYLATKKLQNIDSLSDVTLSMHYFY